MFKLYTDTYRTDVRPCWTGPRTQLYTVKAKRIITLATNVEC